MRRGGTVGVSVRAALPPRPRRAPRCVRMAYVASGLRERFAPTVRYLFGRCSAPPPRHDTAAVWTAARHKSPHAVRATCGDGLRRAWATAVAAPPPPPPPPPTPLADVLRRARCVVRAHRMAARRCTGPQVAAARPSSRCCWSTERTSKRKTKCAHATHTHALLQPIVAACSAARRRRRRCAPVARHATLHAHTSDAHAHTPPLMRPPFRVRDVSGPPLCCAMRTACCACRLATRPCTTPHVTATRPSSKCCWSVERTRRQKTKCATHTLPRCSTWWRALHSTRRVRDGGAGVAATSVAALPRFFCAECPRSVAPCRGAER
jgi:hypothetical protein